MAAPGTQVVPTPDLHDLLEPMFVKIEDTYGGKPYNVGMVLDAGPFAHIYTQVAELTNTSYENVKRRVWAIRNKSSLGTDIAIADAFLLAIDETLGGSNLPVLPTSFAAALEMAEVHFELRGEEIGKKEIEKLAHMMMNFSRAYIRESADPETIAHIKRHNDVTQARIKRQREENPTAHEKRLAERRKHDFLTEEDGAHERYLEKLRERYAERNQVAA